MCGRFTHRAEIAPTTAPIVGRYRGNSRESAAPRALNSYLRAAVLVDWRSALVAIGDSHSAKLAYPRINLRSECAADIWNLAASCSASSAYSSAREVNEERRALI